MSRNTYSYRIKNEETGELRTVSFSEGRQLIQSDPNWAYVQQGRSLTARPPADADERGPDGFLKTAANLTSVSTPRVLAVVDDYDGLIGALRQRSVELGISREVLDDTAGLQSGYSGKLLGAAQTKRFGVMSLGSTLGALGVKMMLVEVEPAAEKIRSRVAVSQQRRKAVTHVKRRETAGS